MNRLEKWLPLKSEVIHGPQSYVYEAVIINALVVREA